MADIIKVKFDEKTKRFPYPTNSIKDFLEVIRTEFKIAPNITLSLLDQDEELSTTSTLEQLGVAKASELTLKADRTNSTYTIKVQTVTGDMSEFHFENHSTLKDLFDAILKTKEFTTTFPLLFNHRMHIFQSTEFLKEPIINFLHLINIKGEHIPHFYLFECDRKFETHKYHYTNNLKDIFLKNDLWQPKSTQQTDLSLLIYLNTMYALVRVFLTEKDVDFDSVHNVYMPQFLIVLRRCLFPPACLAFKHALEGALFDFEKPLLSEAFFHLFRQLLPAHIPDGDLFSYAPYIFCSIFRNGDYTSAENPWYEIAALGELNRSSNASADRGAEKTIRYFVEPVRLLNSKIVNGAADRFVLMEYDGVRNNRGVTENDYQRQTDLIGLLLFLKDFENLSQKIHLSSQNNVYEQFSSDYTLWVPNADTDLLSIGNVIEQRRDLKRFSDDDLERIKRELSTDDLFSILTFADPTKLSKFNHAQFVLLTSGSVVYIKSSAKNDGDSFLCFDPLEGNDSFKKSDAASLDELMKHSQIVVRENAADIRKIEQVTCILFDISGSMHVMVGNENNKQTLLELSTMAFGAWRDRLISYRLAHALGLVYFGADDELTSNPFRNFLIFNSRGIWGASTMDPRIAVQCDITREFTQFEKALVDQPNCGFDTPLYDAINVAIQTIRSFRANAQTRLSPTYKELILCLTDGVDSCSKMSKTDVLQKLLDDKIVFDAISFDTKQNEVLVEFCEKTKGYYYIDIEHNKEYMLNLFELEATISIQDREETVFGKIKQPQRRQSKFLDKPAVASKQAKLSDGRASSISVRRIMLEINNINKKELNNFDLFISKENMFIWKVVMHGETGTPYSDGRWLLFIEFPQIYPQQPPEIRFITKIYHCNINDDGKICHDILNTAWSQKTSIYSVLMEILRLLREPNPDDALSSVKGAQCKESRENYDNTIIEWKRLYASASVEELKAKYSLE